MIKSFLKEKPFFLIASYPRSGNTWCRTFIAEILKRKRLDKLNNIELKEKSQNFDINRDLNTGPIISSKKWIEDQIGINCDYLNHYEMDRIRCNLKFVNEIHDNSPNYYKIHDSYYSPYNMGRSIIPNNCKGVIYLVRNPADLAISLSYFNSWDFEKSVDFLLDKNACLNETPKQVQQYLGSWEVHTQSWTTQDKVPMLVIKYEDLLDEPIENFRKIKNFLNIKVSENELINIINTIKFENLKKAEIQTGYFNERPKTCKYFFRSGEYGQGKLLLSNKQLKKLKIGLKNSINKFNYKVDI